MRSPLGLKQSTQANSLSPSLRDTAPAVAWQSTSTAHNDSKATTAKSTAKKLALSISLVLAAALELSAQQIPQHAMFEHEYRGNPTGKWKFSLQDGGFWIDLDNDVDASISTYTTGNRSNNNTDYRLRNNQRVGDVTFTMNDVANKRKETKLESLGGDFQGSNSTIKSLTINGDTRFKINLSGNTTITTLNHNAVNLQLNANQLTVITLNQTSGTTTQTNGTITTLNLKGGVFNHNGGTLSNVVLQEGDGVFNNNANSAFASITQEGGNHTIGKGKNAITKFTLKSGSLTNNGTITTLTTNTTTTRAFRNAQTPRANHITNNGTIDKLELTKEGDSVTNNAVYNTNGGLASGIIKELNVTSGNATINTLNGVGQGDASNVEPHSLSNISISKDSGKLTVDTLSVGLRGNTAIKRVRINNDTNIATKNLP